MATRLLAINRDGTKHLPLDARTRNLVGQPQQLTPQIRDRVVSQLPDDDRGIPVRLNRMHADRPWMSRLDIHDYRLTRVRRFRAQIRR